MEPSSERTIVISFSNADMEHVADFQLRLNQELRRYRLSDAPLDAIAKSPNAWFYPDQAGGTHYYEEIRERIAQALAVVVVLSAHSGASDWVKREVEWSLIDKKEIIVVALGEIESLRQTKVGRLLSNSAWIDPHNLPPRHRSELGAVIEALRLKPAVIGGTILLGRQLTQRPYGGTFEATRERDQLPVIVKEVSSSDRDVLRELDERVAQRRQLSHLALPRIEDYIQDSERRFVVMEEIPGPSFGKLLNGRDRPFSWDEAKSWAEQILTTLVALHSQDVLHLGLKPDNLKLAKGRVKLLDLGLDRRPQGTSAVGTPDPYLAPEQLSESIADARTDIYATGAILYTLLTGDTQPNATKPPAHKRRRDVPEHVGQAIQQAMDANHTRRFATASDMLAALKNKPSRPPRWFVPAVAAITSALVLMIVLSQLSTWVVPPSTKPTVAAQESTKPAPAPLPSPLATPAEATAAPSAPTQPAAAEQASAPAAELAPTQAPAASVDRLQPNCTIEPPAAGDVVYAIAVVVPFGSADQGDRDKAQAMINAACMAYERFHNDMPRGISLQLLIFDDKGDQQVAEQVGKVIATDTLNQDISCVVGHRASRVSLRALGSYIAASIVMISPSNSRLDVSKNRGYRLAGSDEGQVAAAITFIKESGELQAATKAHIITDNATTLAFLFRQSAQHMDLDLTQQDTIFAPLFSQNPANVQQTVLQIKQQQQEDAFDIIFLAASKVGDATMLIEQLRSNNVTVPIIVNDAIDSRELRRMDQKDVYYVTMSMQPEQMGEFGSNYVSKYNGGELIDIPAYTAETYDATLMCIQAIKVAAEQQPGTPQEKRIQVWEAKEATKIYTVDYKGGNTVTGIYIFDAEHNFVGGGTYYVSEAGKGTLAKYKCTEVKQSTCPEDKRTVYPKKK